MIKVLIYAFLVPISMWAVDCLRLDMIFKKNRINQIKTFYLLISLALAYLVTNFIFDFMIHTEIIK